MGLSLINRLFDALKSFFSRSRLKEEFPSRACLNEVNAIICCLPSEERDLLPAAFVEYFSERADLPPDKTLDMRKPLAEQSFSDETIMFLHYLNCIFTEVKNRHASTAEELEEAQVRATEAFIEMLDGKRDVSSIL